LLPQFATGSPSPGHSAVPLLPQAAASLAVDQPGDGVMWDQMKDFRKDWGNWSQVEQVAVTVAAVMSLVVIVFGFAHS
jgi:hypothetical protein